MVFRFPSQSWIPVVLAAGAGLIIVVPILRALYTRKRIIATVTKLIIYPIKSCKGIEILYGECTPHGLAYGNLRDRQFMVAMADTGEFVSSRTQPTMVLVKTSVDESTSELCINAPDMKGLRVSLVGPQDKIAVRGTVFDDAVEGLDCGKDAADWFTRYLGINVKLLYFDPSQYERHVEKAKGPEFTRQSRPAEKNAVAMFADMYPFLLVNESSVEEVNHNVSAGKVTWKNFRPNILVSTHEGPFAEDNWRAIDINGVRMFCEKPCGRCRLPNVDPDTGIPNAKAEPLNTLYKTRMKKHINTDPLFGMNLILDGGSGPIRVGDTVLG